MEAEFKAVMSVRAHAYCIESTSLVCALCRAGQQHCLQAASRCAPLCPRLNSPPPICPLLLRRCRTARLLVCVRGTCPPSRRTPSSPTSGPAGPGWTRWEQCQGRSAVCALCWVVSFCVREEEVRPLDTHCCGCDLATAIHPAPLCNPNPSLLPLPFFTLPSSGQQGHHRHRQ